MKKLLFITSLLIASSFSSISAQVCESPEDADVDLNSITKCAVAPLNKAKGKKSRQIRVKVSARRRMLKKKVLSTSDLSTSGIAASSTKGALPVGKISKELAANNSIEALKNKLSKEEVRKALKFMKVDNIPTFKTCENVGEGEESDCFNNAMMQHISKHFSYPIEAVRQNLEGDIWVRFIIGKNGYVKNIKTLGPDGAELLNEEAKRVVSLLPRFKPAKKDGQKVLVKYGFPINFSLQE